VPRATVFIAFAFAEAAANLLTNPALDPVGRIPEFKYCAVQIHPSVARAEGPQEGVSR
jgi:formate dehydrogenase major subunit